jgi:hypothetical protein
MFEITEGIRGGDLRPGSVQQRAMTMRATIAFLIGAISTGSAVAQLPAEFATLSCKPTQQSSPDLIVEQQKNQWALYVQSGADKKLITVSTAPISNAQRSSDGAYVVYFASNEKMPKLSGWMLQRLRDGKSVQIAEARLAPISACISPDGQKLAYATQMLAAVQIDLAPAYERFRYWDDPMPKDHVLVPAPDGH